MIDRAYCRSPTVRPVGYRGRWCVSRNVRGRRLSDEYLHCDGVWRAGPQHPETGEFSGYYTSEDEARQALERSCGAKGDRSR